MAFKGSNAVKKKSANQLENLRPGFFLDAMVVRGLEPDDLVLGGDRFGNGGGRGQKASLHRAGVRPQHQPPQARQASS